jgi:hypothetical protein
MGTKTIHWAGREKRRQTNKAVGGSFLKTITELLTNSDSALKKHLGLTHAAGLVEAILAMKPGDRLNTELLKKSLPKRREGKIIVQIYSKQLGRFPSRTCQVIDYGPGMSEAELDRNFSAYAKAKAIGEQTRSLFGRGALDVFLYHSNQRRDDDVDPAANVFSVKDGILSQCRISWGSAGKDEEDSIIETKTLGPATTSILKKHSLPTDLVRSGTVVRFLLAEGTRIPQEGNFLLSLSNFYMLRLIAADPSMVVMIQRYTSKGLTEERLTHDFDLGTVLKRFHDVFRHDRLGEIPVDILVARSDRKMTADYNYERRENGLLFVDDNDAVLDLTLLPQYNNNPLLTRIYGIVKLSGIRAPLEALLNDRRPEAVLTETRDGFDTKNGIAQALFALIETHLKPLYEEEEKRERRVSGNRSADLDRKLKDALQELNKFHNEETGEGIGVPPPVPPEGPLSFAYKKIRLIAGQDRRLSLYAERDHIHQDVNLVEITSSNARVRVTPESELVTRHKGSRFQVIPITLSCPVAGETATITATAFDVEGQDLSAILQVTEVAEPPQIAVPTDIEFRPARYNGKPNIENQLVLLANLDAFVGMPTIKIRIVDREGAVTIGIERSERLEIKTQKDWVVPGTRIAKVIVPYWATAWGAKAEIEAKAKRADGTLAFARCKVGFREQPGLSQYEDIWYEPLDRPVLGEAAQRYIYVNSKPPLHRNIFGDSQETFERALEVDSIAQMRVASIVTDAVVYDVASKKYHKGGEKGLTIGNEPITEVRAFVEEKRYKLDSKIVRAFLKESATQ